MVKQKISRNYPYAYTLGTAYRGNYHINLYRSRVFRVQISDICHLLPEYLTTCFYVNAAEHKSMAEFDLIFF